MYQTQILLKQNKKIVWPEWSMVESDFSEGLDPVFILYL